MILKNVDDKTEILKKLRKLIDHPKLYPSKKRQLMFEIYKIEKGWQNEKEAAHYINTYYKNKKKVIVLHDLRLKYKDISVQIDHLLIFSFQFLIIESKYFSSTLYYDSKNKTFNTKTKQGYKGIPDPIKQTERQILNFKNFLKETGLKKFFPNNFDSLVLVSPNVYFKKKMPEKIVKADRFFEKIEENFEKVGLLEGISILSKHLTTNENKMLFSATELAKFHTPFTYEDYLNMLKLSWIKKAS